MPIARISEYNNVKSLYNLSVNSVINCITYMTCPLQNQKWVMEINKNHSLLLQLPLDILEEIVHTLFKNRNILKEAILHLVTSEFRFLQLKPYNEAYLKIFPNFTKLQVLQISDDYAKADDNCLKLIGTHCQYLRVLDIGYCSTVSDVGIQWLCLNSNQEDHGGTGKCRSLEVLKVHNCYGVTKKGIQIALENLPLLKVLHHDFTFDVLVELAQMPMNQDISNVPRFPLSVLLVFEQHLKVPYYTIGSIGKVLPLCPSLVRLDIRLVKEMTDSDLQGITSLNMLRELVFFREKEVEIEVTFDGGVVPILIVIGSSLTYLNISCFNVVNFSTIIECCPNLSYLTVCRHWHRICSPPKLKQLFRTECRKEKVSLSQLKMLHLEYRSTISSDIWLCLLSSPLLNYIDIKDCDSLTDDVFQHATKVGLFQNLETLYLVSCNSISHQGMDALMTDANPLCRITTCDCKNLTREDVNHLKIKYQDKKWAFTWYYNEMKMH